MPRVTRGSRWPKKACTWAGDHRAGRVIIGIGASPRFDAEAAARRIDLDWSPQGNGIYYTVSDDVDSFRLSPENAEKVAAKISAMADDLDAALDACIVAVIDIDGDAEETDS
jgi:hypothetical protein